MAKYFLLVFLFAFCASESLVEVCLKVHKVVRDCIKAQGREGFRHCLLRHYELEKHTDEDLYGGYRDRLTDYFEEKTKKAEVRLLLEACANAKDVLFCGIEKLANGVCPELKREIYWT